MTPEADPVLEAFDALEAALDAHAEREAQMRERIAHIRARRAEGLEWPSVVGSEDRPLVVELLSRSARELDDAGARLRRSEARALHQSGMTMDAIARLFGVTRQRVSALLRDGDREG